MTGPATGQVSPGRTSVGRDMLPVAALAWLAGTMLLHQLPSLPGWPALLSALVAGAFVWWWRVLRWLSFAIAGFVVTSLAADGRLADRLPAELVGRDVAVTGWVDSFPDHSAERIRFSLRVTDSPAESMPKRLRLNWYESGRELDAGDELELVVRLRRPRGLANPGGFDYERWLFTEGYGATGYVRSGGHAPGSTESVARRWLVLRAALAERIETAVGDADAAALLTALTLGERMLFTDEHWTGLRRTGTSHLVAISGMHVGMIAALVFALARWCWLRLPLPAARFDLEAAAALALVAACLYAALAGFAIPTQRALVMVAVALCFVVSRVAAGLMSGLAIALLAVLVHDPFAPLSASFWMSFIAVALLLMMAQVRPLTGRHRHGARRWFETAGTLARLQWNISLGLVPLMAVYFGELSLVSPAVNFLAIPFFTVLLVPGTLAAALTLLIDPAVGAVTVQLMGQLARGTWWVLGSLAAQPWAAISLPVTTSLAAALAFVAVLAAVPSHALPGRRLAWLALVPLAVPAAIDRPDPGSLRAHVLDVGHGLAVLVQTHSHVLLYDAGPRYRSGFDSGQDVVLPVLDALRLASPSMIVISHDHNDHTGGVAAVLARSHDTIVLKGPDVDDPSGGYCVRGQQWRWDGVDFSIVHPAPDFAARGNESSCVLLIRGAGGSLLLTGDIERRAERALHGDADARADVVVVAHHGSATSSSPAFVAGTGASHALISVDYYSRWRFPRPEVRARWQAAGAEVWVTGESGALTILIDSGRVQVRAERLRRVRYWHAERHPLSGESGRPAL